ncbi:MAG: NAD-dependent succinate-semialdehyde dehydrogenase, partial [Pseudonocardiaceae bacterium]
PTTPRAASSGGVSPVSGVADGQGCAGVALGRGAGLADVSLPLPGPVPGRPRCAAPSAMR